MNIYRKMYDDLDKYFSCERKLIEETQNNLEKLKEHRSDIELFIA